MAAREYLKAFNEFLSEQTGATGECLDQIIKKQSISHAFFRPMKSVKDLKKLYTPISAPIACGIMAIEILIEAAVDFIKGIYALLINRDLNVFGNEMYSALVNLIISTVFLVIAIASPIINLVDLAGSVITTGIDLFCTKNDNLDSDEIDSENEELDSDSESSSLSYN